MARPAHGGVAGRCRSPQRSLEDVSAKLPHEPAKLRGTRFLFRARAVRVSAGCADLDGSPRSPCAAWESGRRQIWAVGRASRIGRGYTTCAHSRTLRLTRKRIAAKEVERRRQLTTVDSGRGRRRKIHGSDAGADDGRGVAGAAGPGEGEDHQDQASRVRAVRAPPPRDQQPRPGTSRAPSANVRRCGDKGTSRAVYRPACSPPLWSVRTMGRRRRGRQPAGPVGDFGEGSLERLSVSIRAGPGSTKAAGRGAPSSSCALSRVATTESHSVNRPR